MSEQPKQYYAFISYKREDEKWAKWIQHMLEHYKFPTNLNGCTNLPKKIRPTFRDVTDLTPGFLAEEIHEALVNSQWLIIVCSPRSAKSKWVCNEAQTFIDLGRADHIIPFVIEGKPFSNDETTECYPEALLNLTECKEILAANIHEMGRKAAVVKVIAKMFGLDFDSLWQRYQREQLKSRIIKSVLGLVLFLLLIGSAFLSIRIFDNKVVAYCKNGIHQDNGIYDVQRKLLNYQRYSFLLTNETRSILRQTIYNVDYYYNVSPYPILHTYQVRVGQVVDLNFNSEESRILVGTRNNETTGILDYKYGVISLLNDASNSLDYLHQDTIIACGQGVRIYADGKKISEYKVEGYSMKVNPEGNNFVLNCWDVLTTYNIHDGTTLTQKHFEKDILCFDYNKSGEYIAVSTSDSILSLIKATTGELVSQRKCEKPVVALTPSTSELSFFVAYNADTINVSEVCLDCNNKDSLLFEVPNQLIRPNQNVGNRFQLSCAKGEIIAFTNGRYLVVHNLKTKEFMTYDANYSFQSNFESFALSSSGTKLAYTINGKIYVLLIKFADERHLYPIQHYGFSDVIGITNAKLYSNDSTIVMSVVHNDSLSTVAQYNLYSGKQLNKVIASKTPVINVLPLSNKHHAAVALQDENCWKIFDFTTASPIKQLTMENDSLGPYDYLTLTANKKYLIGLYAGPLNVRGRDWRAIWSATNYDCVDSTYCFEGPLQDGIRIYKNHYIYTYPDLKKMFAVEFSIPSQGCEIFDGDEMAFMDMGFLQVVNMKNGEKKSLNLKPYVLGNTEYCKLLGYKYGYALLSNLTQTNSCFIVLDVKKEEPILNLIFSPNECFTSVTFFNSTKRIMFTTSQLIYVVDLVDFDKLCSLWRDRLEM